MSQEESEHNEVDGMKKRVISILLLVGGIQLWEFSIVCNLMYV